VIRLISITHGYGGQTVLKGLDLALGPGERLVVSGRSGVGKTTLVRLIAGLEVPDAGNLEIDGRSMHHGRWLVPPHERAISMVFQRPALWQHMKVSAHLEFVAPGSRHQRTAAAAAILQAAGLERLKDRYPQQLSEGQARRVAIARALAARARYMLMDEPLVNLDREAKLSLAALINSHVTDTGMGLIYITHDDDEAAMVGGARAWMDQGRLWGSPSLDRSFGAEDNGAMVYV
jgi:iron(III) transport system ATP-binding protein